MISLTRFNRRFTPGWRMTILAIVALVFFTRLGFWQLQRAEEKKQMLAAQARLAKQEPLTWTDKMVNPKQYQPIVVKGDFLPEILLLDNQHYQHQFGYHVLSPLMLVPGKVVLIDRGWIAGDMTRRTLPTPSVPIGSVKLTGSAYYPFVNWVLGQAYEKKQDKLTIIERIDTNLIGQFLHQSVYPFIIRLNKDEAQGYVREWAVVSMPPERHYAYALQWFALAGIILILYLVLNLQIMGVHEKN
jgi:surfeit locus 1 family protein